MLKKISNPVIGEIEYEENSVITFTEGMLGLPSFKKFLLLESENIKPFYRLQCVDEPGIGFLLIDPVFVDMEYHEFVKSMDKDSTYIDENGEYVILVVCKAATDGEDITANLVAPVVINYNSNLGYQLVLIDSPYDVRHSLAQVSTRKEA